MANMTFGVNLIPKANAGVTLGNSNNPWTIVDPKIIGSIDMGRADNSDVGVSSVAEGDDVTASGSQSYAGGLGTVANHASQHVFGEYNVPDPSEELGSDRGDYIEIVGNGTDDENLSNARALDWDGNEYIGGNVYVNCDEDSTGGTRLATISEIPDVSDKADIVSGATSGNFAGLDGYGNLTDSGYSHTDFLTQQDINGKADKNNTVITGSLSMGRAQGTDRGSGSTVLGDGNEASGSNSTATGNQTRAIGNESFASGYQTIAKGEGSTAEGDNTIAYGNTEHAGGRYNFSSLTDEDIADWDDAETYEIGDIVKYVPDGETSPKVFRSKINGNSNNEPPYDDLESDEWIVYTLSVYTFLETIGNGDDDATRANARALTDTGDERLAGDVYVQCNDDSTGGHKLISFGDSNASLGIAYGTCTTGASETDKEVTASGYNLRPGGFISVKFSYDVPEDATMNVNNQGERDIYYRGSAISDGVIKAGDIATFVLSTHYHLIAIDRVSTGQKTWGDLI